MATQRGGVGGWEGGPRERGYMCTYSQFTLLYSRIRHNILKPLHPIKIRLRDTKQTAAVEEEMWVKGGEERELGLAKANYYIQDAEQQPSAV